jgi:hypothetical protein
MFDHEDYVRHRVTLSDQKLSAWALAVGERPRTGDAWHRRAHRGTLPDVDFDRAVPDPTYRSFFGRIVEFFWGRKHEGIVEPSARAVLRAELAAALGERLAAAYLGEEESDDAAPMRAAEGKAVKNDLSRAA